MSREPIFNIPEKSIFVLIVILLGMHALSKMTPMGEPLYEWFLLLPMETLYPVTTFRQAISLLGHGFLHGGWSHVFMNSGMILIFGLITFRGIRAKSGYQGLKSDIKFWMIFCLGVIFGGLMQWGWWAVTNTLESAALGASGGASALFATAGWAIGGRQRLIGFGLAWILINAMVVAAESMIGPISWAAHMGGFIMGALLAPYWLTPNSAGRTF